MKIGYIILSRFNSSRLPGKVLKKINGKPILQHIIDSLLELTERENIVVAMSNKKTDDIIEDYCNNNNINAFRGSLENVAKRFLDCALHYGFDFATRINGDNIFIDNQTISEMISVVRTNKFDFVSNVKKRTFPKGMSVEIVSVTHFKELFTKFKSQEDFEHVTYYLYNNDKNKKYYYHYNKHCPEAAGIQLAIDTVDDFELISNIFRKHIKEKKAYTLKDIYQFYKTEYHEK